MSVSTRILAFAFSPTAFSILTFTTVQAKKMKLFSLAKLAYASCSPEDIQRTYGVNADDVQRAIDLQPCCMRLIRVTTTGQRIGTADRFAATVCTMAAVHGHLDCLSTARRLGMPWDERTIAAAARNGRMDCLRYCHLNGCPWYEDACTEAAANGQLEALRYCHENGAPWSAYTSRMAVTRGELGCLRYCRENGCPMDRRATVWAAAFGRLDCLRYAHLNGGEWSVRVTLMAHMNVHAGCFEYAVRNGCPMLREVEAAARLLGFLDAAPLSLDRKTG